MKIRFLAVLLILSCLFVGSDKNYACINDPPNVSITYPYNGTIFAEGDNVLINASASDSDGDVTKVEFYQGSTKLGEVTSAPYSYMWYDVPAGPAGGYSLTAKAFDNDGAMTTSAPPVNITVTDIWYVDADATGGDGQSWGWAFNSLQDALANASSGDEIRVAEGIYKPDQGVGITPGDRAATFQLKNGVTVYGGFAGYTPGGGPGSPPQPPAPDPDTRDIAKYKTVLSGDIDDDDLDNGMPDEQNSYHVVTGCDGAVLDGFTITRGYADDNAGFGGGGMFNNNNASPVVLNCIFEYNLAAGNQQGGAVYNGSGCGPMLINCLLIGNMGRGNSGGAIYHNGDTLWMNNCTVANNAGDGIHCNSADLVIYNSIIWHNRADVDDSAYPLREICLFNTAQATIGYSNVEGGEAGVIQEGTPVLNWGAGNASGSEEPEFVEWGQWDWRQPNGTDFTKDDPFDFDSAEITIRDLLSGFSDVDRQGDNSSTVRDFLIADTLDTSGDIPKPDFDFAPGFKSTCSNQGSFGLWFNNDDKWNGPINTNMVCEDAAKGILRLDSDHFFPVDDSGFGELELCHEIPDQCPEGTQHNYFFTFEYHPESTYVVGQTLYFRSSDDLFVAFNDQVLIDKAGYWMPDAVDANGYSESAIVLKQGEIEVWDYDYELYGVPTRYSNLYDQDPTDGIYKRTISTTLRDGDTYNYHLFWAQRHPVRSILLMDVSYDSVPFFETGDYHLTNDGINPSPCIDAGDNRKVPYNVPTDLDGNPRFIDDPDTYPDLGYGTPPIVDMGADEYEPLSVDAGIEQVIALPTVTANLNGTVTGGIPGRVATNWSQDSGPGTVIFGDPSIVDTTATFPMTGIYVLKLKAEDGFSIEEDPVTITVHEVPVVDAGVDQLITLPTNSVNLDGTVTDDGLPNPQVDVTWLKVSGPGSVNFGDEDLEDTTATFGQTGVYVLRLLADDGAVVVSDTVTIIVNEPPTVDAGEDQLITLPIDYVDLDGAVTDDGLPNPLGTVTLTWSKDSGPGTVTFGNDQSEDTTATFDQGGVYVLILEADDGAVVVSDIVTITVNEPPEVDAGAKQEITLPTDTANLDGTVVDDDIPVTATKTWSKVSGRGTVTFGDENDEDTTATFDQIDVYVLKLEADDTLSVVSDTVRITVKPGPGPGNHMAPIVEAGAEKTIDLGDILRLDDSEVTDDGIPNPPGAINVQWSVVSGGFTGDVTFANPSQVKTSAIITLADTYVLKLEASDGELTGNDTVIVTVNPGNLPPVIDAGNIDPVQLPGSFPNLAGVVVWDEEPSTVTPTWSVVRVPDGGEVVFNPSPPQVWAPQVTFNRDGTYVLQLDAFDAEGLPAKPDLVMITVHPQLIVDAGDNQEIQIDNTVLDGEIKNDLMGLVDSTLWSRVPGAGTVTFGDDHSEDTTATFSLPGNYVLRLEAKNAASQVIGSDEVHIRVSGPPTEYSSYVFSVDDLIFFSYEDGVTLEYQECDQSGNPIGNRQPVNGDEPLNKGQSETVELDNIFDTGKTGVYKIFSSSKKFTVLTGDPTYQGVSGYFAMNPDGLGVGTEFYTYVPYRTFCYQYLVVIAYEGGTLLTVEESDDGTGLYNPYVADHLLGEGKHWAVKADILSDKYIHVSANKPVSVLTSHDTGYYVPSSNGKWSGTKFYTFMDCHSWCDYPYDEYPDLQNLWVIAYDDTLVNIWDIAAEPDELLWSGMLGGGNAYIRIGKPLEGSDEPEVKIEEHAYIGVTSDKPVTVNVGPPVVDGYAHGDFMPDRKGTGIGTEFIGRCIMGTKAYFYILAYMDETNVRVYNSEDGTFKADYTRNAGQTVNANAINDSGQPEENFLGEGLWRVLSDKPVSVQSGAFKALAEFVPLDFDVKESISEFWVSFVAIDIEDGGDCVLPVDTGKDTIAYTINYSNSLAEPVYGVKIVDHLPKEVDFISADHAGYYEVSNHTFTREIGTLGAGASDSLTIVVKVNNKAKPSGTISNLVEMESLDYYDADRADDVSVCGWAEWTEQNIIFVNENAVGGNNGTSWQDAYTDLQDALDTAQQLGTAQIWVAEGTYTPRKRAYFDDRSVTFQLINGVEIYGGFAGTETNLEDRDWETNETVLSGDLRGYDVEVANPADLQGELTRTENCYHVVTGSGTDNTTVLDGFTIKGGNANRDEFTGYPEYLDPDPQGGGMYNDNGSLTIRNCTFSCNSATSGGGGIYNYNNSSPEVINCTFDRNSSNIGGGMCNLGGSPKLIDCEFINNYSLAGGGMFNYSNNDSVKPELTGCTFIENSARRHGGGMYNGEYSDPYTCGDECGFEVTLTDCTFIRNSADYSPSYDGFGGGIYNITTNSSSTLKLTNCTLNGNISKVDGGGIYNKIYFEEPDDSGFDLNLVNCVFCGNSAGSDGYDGYGGGISNYFRDWDGQDTHSCNLTLTNCTFASNTASYGRTLVCHGNEYFPDSSTVQFTNCILWNAGDEIQKYDNSAITINYSDYLPQGAWPGIGNIDGPPEFMEVPSPGTDGIWGTEDDNYGDLRLDSDSGSPCIDAADNDAVLNLNIETDLNGDPRRVDDPGTEDTGAPADDAPYVDMGAYERQLLTVDAGSYNPSVLTLLPTNKVSLYLNHATIVPPNPPGELTQHWSMPDGPDDVAFDNYEDLNPIVTFYKPGTYVLMLEAFVDGQIAGSDTVTITVRLDVDAGEYDDVTMSIGEGTLDLVGTVTGGVYDTVLWSRASGKCAVSFQGSSSLTPTATFTDVGEYVLRLEARNASGEVIGWDDAIVMVHSYDQQPAVEAGTDQDYILPTGGNVSHFLEDAWCADGIPPVQETQWSVDGDPAGVTFVDPGVDKTTAIFTEIGEYVLRLVAKDATGTVIAEDIVTITIFSDNQAPIVNAGYYFKTDRLPNCQIDMSDAWVFDDFTPVENLDIEWTSDPDTGVEFSDPDIVPPTVTFTQAGDYLLTLQATDDASTPLTGSDTVWVTIYPEDEVTTVNAGSDKVTALLQPEDPDEEPSVSIYLDDAFVVFGTPGERSAEWSVISGPDLSPDFYPAASYVNPIVTFVTAGDYTLKLTVRIDGEEVGSDTMDIIVGPVGFIVDDTPPFIANVPYLLELNGMQLDCSDDIEDSGYGELTVRVNGADGGSGVRKVELRWDGENGLLLKEVIGSPSYPAQLQLEYVVDTQDLNADQTYTFYARVTDKIGNWCSTTFYFKPIDPPNPSTTDDPPIAKITNSLFFEEGTINPKVNPMPIISDGFFILEGAAYHLDPDATVFYKIELFKNEIGEYEEQYWNPTYTLYHDYFVKNVTPGAANGFFQGTVLPGQFPEPLDFTGVENGVYQMLLTVKCEPFYKRRSVGFVLDCPLKLGNIKFSQEDLVIPVSGVPLRVVRTYDSLRKNLDGEFGHGWTYTVADMDFEIHEERRLLRSDPELGGGDDMLVRWGPNHDRNVSLTLPDGRRAMFSFYLLSDDGFVPKFTAKFMPPYGIDVELKAYCNYTPSNEEEEKMNSLGLWEGQGMGLYGYDNPATHDFRIYVLTTEDGTKYIFEREDYGGDIFEVEGLPYWAHARGPVYLNRIKTPTGDTIELNVDLSTGEIGKFENRGIEYKCVGDNQDPDYVPKAIEIKYTNGRITAINAPSEKGETDNPTIKYVYDEDNGNLTEVHKLVVKDDLSTPSEDETDYETIKYIYDDDDYDPDDHYITKIMDPRGLNPIIYEYDEEGRLEYVYDAKGNQIHIDHSDTANKTETVKDRSGNSTIYQYDNRGNVVSVTNSLSQTTLYEYGDTEYSDAASEVRVPLVPNADPDNDNDYAITTTDYDTSGRPLTVTGPEGNITENSYDSRDNILTSTQKLPLPDGSEVITTENVYYGNRLIFTGTRKGDPPDDLWHSMTLSYYYYDEIYHFLTGVDYVQVNIGQDIDNKEDVFEGQELKAIELLLGSGHAVTSYQYSLQDSGSDDQPYSITDPTGLTRYFKYDENNKQVASWHFWDDVTNNDPDQGYDKCVITLSDLDVQGRTIRTRRVVQSIANEANPSAPDIVALLAGTDGIVLSQTAYNKIGKAETVSDEHGNYTQYDYDETGNLVETRTYDSGDNLLTTAQTLYDVEGRTLVTVGPYATGDRPVGTETVYDVLGRVIKTRRWENVAINLVDLVVDGTIVGKTVNPNATVANAWDDGDTNPDAGYNAGWTSNGRIPVVDVANYNSTDHEIPLSHSRTVYDAGGRVKHSVALDEDGKEQPTTYYYDKAGKQTIVIDPKGHQGLAYVENTITGFWEIDFSNFDDTVGTGNLTGTHKTETQYVGTQRSSVTDARVNTTSFEYDDLGRLETTTHPDAVLHDTSPTAVPTYTHVGYDGLGRKAWQSAQTRQEDEEREDLWTDARDFKLRKRYFEYDAAGRLTATVLPEPEQGAGIPRYDYFYDNYGNQVGILDSKVPSPRLTVLKYDHLNRQTARYMPFVVDPANITDAVSVYAALAAASPTPNSEERSYDNMGRLEMMKDYIGQITGFEYNNRGQLRYKKYYIDQAAYDAQNPSETIEYTYDNLGRKYEIIEARGTTTYYYNDQGKVYQVDTPEGTLNYDYDFITGRKNTTSTANTENNFFYDKLGRLETVNLVKRDAQTVSERSDYTYNPVGSRESLTYANGNYTYHVYDAINRLTSLTNFEEFEPTPETLPNVETLSKFEYSLYADGMRSKATEKILPQGVPPDPDSLKKQVVTYTYDDLNRLIMEVGDDPDNPGNGYTAEYEYDLVGNRLSRAVYFGHRDDELLTEYQYNDKDQLLKEIHTDDVPWVAIQHNDGPYYAYAGESGIFYTKANSKVKIGPFKAWLIGLPSPFSHWLFGLVIAMLIVAFLLPAIMHILARIRKREPARMPLSLRNRCLSVLLAYVMLIAPCGLQQLSRASTQYSQLGKSSWGTHDRIIEYGHWDGGSPEVGNFLPGYDKNGSVIEKITWDTEDTPTRSDDTKVEVVFSEYNLQNRLARVATYDYITLAITVVAYKYNANGIRVQKIDDPDGAATTTTYLVDAYNHTGYAQVLEESGANLKTYTIGDDILTQATDSGTGRHLLYDGHGSTRQLVSGSVGSTSIVDDFSYDGYGVLLQDEDNFPPNGTQAPGKVSAQATSLLYAGEHFDTDSQNYYLRARWYDSLSGRFNRMDPFAGNNQDPQSLHKYLYAHCNPINSIDPTGQFEFSLSGMFITAMIVGIISGIIAGTVTAIKGGTTQQIINAATTWFWRGFAAGAAVYGGIWATHSILVALYGAGAGLGDLQYAKQYGIQSYNALKDAVSGTGLHRHHIIQQRFAPELGLKARDMACVVVSPEEHLVFRRLWQGAISYGAGTANATKEVIWFHAQEIYEGYPALLDAARATLGMWRW